MASFFSRTYQLERKRLWDGQFTLSTFLPFVINVLLKKMQKWIAITCRKDSTVRWRNWIPPLSKIPPVGIKKGKKKRKWRYLIMKGRPSGCWVATDENTRPQSHRCVTWKSAVSSPAEPSFIWTRTRCASRNNWPRFVIRLKATRQS